MTALTNKSISSWIRQARHRAKKHNIYSNLEVADVLAIVQDENSLCAYCVNAADTLDCPFPLKNDGPHVPANVLPCCKSCKTLKGSDDIVQYFANGHIEREKYLALIQKLFKRRGGDLIKEHMRRITGY